MNQSNLISVCKPKKLARAESFLGLHFDFHAGEDCKEIGKTVTEDMVQYVLDKVRPDFVHCDCSGHPGYSSYPTKIGHPAPGFVKDQLRIWRDVTEKNNTPLYVHFCGLWSSKNATTNPDWACVGPDGAVDKQLNSCFGQFGEKLLVPQLAELVDQYQIDGAWIDGDCWGAVQDYRQTVLDDFKKKTGCDPAQIAADESCFAKFTEHCRQGYRNYLKKYVDSIHRHNPKFQICCNWAYSSFMPEPVSIPVDFLSGDYPSVNSLNHARFEARYLAHQGKPWDLMAWSFAFKAGTHIDIKSTIQMQQEAAITIALGGAITFYFPQTRRDGSISRWQMDEMAGVAEFCRQRQHCCHQIKPVPQIALLHSTYDYYRVSRRLFAPRDPFIANPADICESKHGILQCLLESQNVVDVVSEHHLESSMNQYGLIVIPELKYIDSVFKDKLLDYVRNGGNLLVIGTASAELFQNELGIKFDGPVNKKSVWLEHDGRQCTLNSYYKGIFSGNQEVFGKLYSDYDAFGPYLHAASCTCFGKGKIAGIYFDMGENYACFATPTLRKFLKAAVDRLFINPIVKVSGSQYVDVSLASQPGRLFINLVNTSGPHSNRLIHVFDEVPTLKDIHIEAVVSSAPAKVRLLPENKTMDYKFDGKQISFILPELKIHSVIVIETQG